jgi:hypothetical protein
MEQTFGFPNANEARIGSRHLAELSLNPKNLQSDERRENLYCGTPPANVVATLIFALEETMGPRYDTAKRSSNIKDQSLAARLLELRELRDLVRKMETRAGDEEAQLTSQPSFKDHIPSEVRSRP